MPYLPLISVNEKIRATPAPIIASASDNSPAAHSISVRAVAGRMIRLAVIPRMAARTTSIFWSDGRSTLAARG
jgi:hypothetical protein